MNIFATSDCPCKCAVFLDDVRCVKMVLETAQLLSTAINEHGGKGPYKSTHINHPSSKWARETRGNYEWLLSHFEALCEEYTSRYNKTHKCAQFTALFAQNANLIPSGDQTPFPNCTTYKNEPDVHLAYKLYMNDKWDNDKRTPTWHGVSR